MNGVDLFLLGRALMKLGEDALPEPPDGAGKYIGLPQQVGRPVIGLRKQMCAR